MIEKSLAICVPRQSVTAFSIRVTWLAVGIACALIVSDLPAQDIGIRAEPLPKGFHAKASTQNNNGIDWVAMSITSISAEPIRAQVAVEKRAMPTHAERLNAAKSYVNTLVTTLSKTGFKPVDIKMPDFERADFTEKLTLQVTFANATKQKLLCAIQIWFTSEAGHCAAVISAEQMERQALLTWISTVRTEETPEPETRTWTSLAGQTVEAKLVSSSLGKARIARKDGSEVQIPVSQLSEADQNFIKASPLQRLLYKDERHSARTLLPQGFAPARPIRKEAQSFRHLNGNGLHFVVLPWPKEDVTLQQLLATTSQLPADSIKKLPNAKLEILTTRTPAPKNGILARYFGTKLANDHFLLVVGESNVGNMPEWEPIYAGMMQIMQSK